MTIQTQPVTLQSPTEQSTAGDQVTRNLSKDTLQPSNSPPARIDIKLEQYYAVDYVNRFYIGRVVEIGETPQHWAVKFLHQSAKEGKPVFTWPRKSDYEEVHECVIFYGPIQLEGCGEFQVKNFHIIQKKFEQIKKH